MDIKKKKYYNFFLAQSKHVHVHAYVQQLGVMFLYISYTVREAVMLLCCFIHTYM